MTKKSRVRAWLKYIKNYKNNKWILEDYDLVKKSFENRKKRIEKDVIDLKTKNLNEIEKLQEIINSKTNTIFRDIDTLNDRNKQIQELNKNLSDKILKIDELMDKVQKLEDKKEKLTEENKKLKLTNEFLKNNRRAPTREEIIAFEKNQKEVLKRQRLSHEWIIKKNNNIYFNFNYSFSSNVGVSYEC